VLFRSSPTFNQTYLTGVGNSASLFYVSSIITGSLYLLIQHGSGQIGVTYFNSSSKEKKNIRSIEIDSFLLHQLNYKSFEMKNDKTERKQFGLIAEEVHEICPDLVAYEEDGITPFFVRYDMVGVLAAMETTKQQKIIDDLLKRIEKLEKKNG
jgi:NurA-like 5'-3' nuclease